MKRSFWWGMIIAGVLLAGCNNQKEIEKPTSMEPQIGESQKPPSANDEKEKAMAQLQVNQFLSFLSNATGPEGEPLQAIPAAIYLTEATRRSVQTSADLAGNLVKLAGLDDFSEWKHEITGAEADKTLGKATVTVVYSEGDKRVEKTYHLIQELGEWRIEEVD